MKMLTMRSMMAMVAALALIGPITGGSAASAAGKRHVKADTLTGYQETPAVSSPATGSFTAEIDEGTSIITYKLTYTGLTAAALFAHIHFGYRFIAGGVSAFLCGGGGKPACPPGTVAEAVVAGTILPADIIGPAGQGIAAGEFDELIRAIRAGVTYVNVHSTTFPTGEIRGQINNDDQRQP